jgi:lipopolysaccharide biosynthesis glycosyltransferase
MALDNGYIYLTIVSITSVMLNSNNRNKYEFYIMHPADLLIENKNKLLNFENKYNRCIINLLDMGNKYVKAKIDQKISAPSYYRLSLPDLLPNMNKIIWIDGDTITFKDLKELYDIDMNNYYFKGYLDDCPYCVDHITFENDHLICAGVLLINLNELRKDNIVNKVSKFIEENTHRLIQHDQTTINSLDPDKIDILPAKFGIFNYDGIKTIEDRYTNIRYKYKYSMDDLIDSFNNPSILHYVFKPWGVNHKYLENIYWMKSAKFGWWYYAQKSDYYTDIFIWVSKKKFIVYYKKYKKKIKKTIRIAIPILCLYYILKYFKKI